jgi:hypothetical protein
MASQVENISNEYFATFSQEDNRIISSIYLILDRRYTIEGENFDSINFENYQRVIRQILANDESISQSRIPVVLNEFEDIFIDIIRENQTDGNLKEFELLGESLKYEILKDQDKRKNFECYICLEKFKNDDKIFDLCNSCHLFHENCLEKWVKVFKNSSCPVCRKKIIKL